MDHARPEPREHTLIAPTTDQWRLLDIQGVDTRMQQIAHSERTLPEHAELAELEQQATVLRDDLVRAQTAASDTNREFLKAEADVEQVRQRAARDQARLDSGQGGHKDLESLQHELATLARRQSDLEDVELEVMERLEAFNTDVDRLGTEQAALQEKVAVVVAARDAKLVKLADERESLQRDRAGMVLGLDAPLLALYEKIRESSGAGAAMLRARRCEGCRLELNPQELQRIRAAADDEVVRCDDCRRILVRTGESGL
ncbi:zinc ribbon domain-containing protein [Angustibacter sp. McL0619]|uniref:zinc ribbon domain-containing protein n=1 Tax=Angustibacter sp. McL0619 TaxID=3415676 RepID=UPI003CF60290